MSCKIKVMEGWMQDLRNRRLRFAVSLKKWIAVCYLLAAVFDIISSLSTNAVIKTGVAIEGNPIMRALFERFSTMPVLVVMQAGGFAIVALLLFVLRKTPFSALMAAHLWMIIFFFTAMNDLSYVAPGWLGGKLSIFITHEYPFAYIINVAVFSILTFFFTLLVTKQKKLEH